MRAPRRGVAAVLPPLVIVAAVVIVAAGVCAAADAAADAAGNSGAGGVPFDSPGGLVIVRADARGATGRARGLHLLLDTGDPGGVTLFASVARALGLFPGPARPGVAHGLNGSMPIERRSARLPALVLDVMTWRDLPIDVIEQSDSLPEGLGAGVDGVIGVETVRATRLTIDYAARRMSLDPGGDPESETGPADDGATVPTGERSDVLRYAEGRLITWIGAGEATFPALIDTASGRTLVDRGAGLSSGTTGTARLADA